MELRSWLQPKNHRAGVRRGSGLQELRRADARAHPAVGNRALAKQQYADVQHPDAQPQPQKEDPPPRERPRAGSRRHAGQLEKNRLRENRERVDPNLVPYQRQLSESALRRSH
ncbi:MAG: hypothetical protein ABR582_00590 [Gemmatimonadaceae bacterium]